MEPQYWQRIKEHFGTALELAPAEREGMLAALAAQDPGTHVEVRKLLLSHDAAAEGFLETPAAKSLQRPQVDQSAQLPIGHRIGGFTVLGKLGQGSAATVYLAHETQLERRVALKISRASLVSTDNEARVLAPLDFDHIVKIHSERVDTESGTRILCMQYIPGPSLDELLRACERNPGAHPLEVLGEREGSTLSSSQREERERLLRLDPAEYLLWLVARIAEALDYAHQKGILHLDVKPGNILVCPSGRPLLSDFNVSVSQAALDTDSAGALLGGTRRYMPPEQVAAFEGKRGVVIDARADVYALGRVIREVMDRTGALAEGALADHQDLTAEVERVVTRATASEQRERYPTAHALRRELESTLEVRRIARKLPGGGVLDRLAVCWPFGVLLFVAVLPQVVADVVNIVFNTALTTRELTYSQQLVFQRMTIAYNAVVAPIITFVFLRRWSALRKEIRERLADPAVTSRELASTRAKTLRLSDLVIRLTSGSWIPAAIYFPLGLQWLAPPVSAEVVARFIASFVVGWLIALSYTYLYLEYIAVRSIYPRLWRGETGIGATARRELKRVHGRFDFVQLLASAAPLAASALALYTGQHTLCGILIFLGGFGAYHSGRVSKRMQRTLAAFF